MDADPMSLSALVVTTLPIGSDSLLESKEDTKVMAAGLQTVAGTPTIIAPPTRFSLPFKLVARCWISSSGVWVENTVT